MADPLHRLYEIAEDWTDIARRDGYKTSLQSVVSDIKKIPYRHLHLVLIARSLLEPLPEIELKCDLKIRDFTPSDLESVRQIDCRSQARLCARRLEQGHKGLLAIVSGKPVGYAWGSTDLNTRLERVHPHLVPGDFLCTDAYTMPSYRGLGIQTTLTVERFRLFRELGYCRAISYIEVSNAPSLSVWLRKLHGQQIGTIDFLRIGPWYRIRYC